MKKSKQAKEVNKHYSKEFKAEAVKLVLEQGLGRSQVARDLGVHVSSICNWVNKWQQDGEHAFPGKGKLKPQDEEIRQLKRDLRRTQMERDILKKAIAFFAEVPK